MFNSINCNDPPIGGFFIIWSILYRVDLLFWATGYSRDPPGIPVHTLRAIWTPGTILVSRRVPITHNKS